MPIQQPSPLDTGELYRKYHKHIFRLCTKFIWNVEDARDAVQDIFLKAHKNQKMYTGESKPNTWLSAIARNHCRDLHRNRKRLIPTVNDDIIYYSVAEQLAEDSFLSAVEWASLDSNQRFSIWLVEKEGLDNQEVNEILFPDRKKNVKRVGNSKLQECISASLPC